ncbi:hypothetical protein ACP3WT_25390, partial [Salmonella enterica]|uniref:hypothetical protein n=1 Tax=Salmonella enterica TaxID=28901 RepID=UPI003CF4518B
FGCFSDEPKIPDVTPEKFSKIHQDMKYKDVAEIFGSPGHQSLSNEASGIVFRTYSWPNSKGGSVLVVFSEDTVFQALPGMEM